MDITAYLREKGDLVGAFLDAYFTVPLDDGPPVLYESMRYSVMAGGKRIRPVLALAAYEVSGGGDPGAIVRPASALEVIHTYSLIHDDLPAMDDDDLRRGKPTNHKVFGEAIAILAGDGLLSEAFLMILDTPAIPPERLLRAARELSDASGPRGMVGGQVQDLLSENAAPDPKTLHYIHTRKTGALLAASVRFGGILAGADDPTMGILTAYGRALGHAFQIVDDILDIQGEEAVIGKPVGSDLAKNKMTYPALYGLEESHRLASALIDEAAQALEPLGERALPLREIARYILKRRS